jgi:site-specific DNA recombinase
LGTVAALQVDLRRRGIVSKVWKSTSGRARGGSGYSRGALYYLLRNQIYVGRVAHKQESYEGQHTAIVGQDLWDSVQTRLAAKGAGQRRGPINSNRSPLLGLLRDDRGNLMSPSYTKKRNGRRYRYYVSQALLQNDRARAGTVSRVSAEAIEQLVDGEVRRRMLPDDPDIEQRLQRGEARLPLREIVNGVVLRKDHVEITLTADAASKLVPSERAAEGHVFSSKPGVITVPVRLASRGRGIGFEGVGQRTEGSRPDAVLVKAIYRAHEWRGRFERGEVTSYHALARAEGVTPSYVRSVLQLAFLAPELVEVFLDGRKRLRGGLMALLAQNLAPSWRRQHEAV